VPRFRNWSLDDVTIDPRGRVWAVGARGDGSIYGVYALVIQLCPTVVSDAGFSRGRSIARLGAAVFWRFDADNATAHDLRDDSGLGLFHLPNRRPGTITFIPTRAAGWYPIEDSTTGATTMIGVRPDLSRTDDGVVVRWAKFRLRDDLVFDVSLRTPRSDGYFRWKTGTTSVRDVLPTRAGSGEYLLRARVRSASTGRSVRWSPVRRIEVSSGPASA
jgi:hypothetical protein